MFISEEELNRRLGSNKNLNNSADLSSLPESNKSKDSVDTTSLNKDVPKAFFGFTSTLTPQVAVNSEVLKNIAASLVAQGINADSVSSELAVSHADIKSADQGKISKGLESVRELALERLLIALGIMTPDKFADASFKELSASVANLARVVQNTTPASVVDNRLQFLVYTPPVKTLADYEVIDV